MFDSHVLNDEGFKEMSKFKATIAKAVKEVLPQMGHDSREKSVFMTKIEEAVFFGAKAIAQQEGNHQDKKVF